MKNEIEIDGVKYVKKQEFLENYKIVRTHSAGVFVGEIVARNGKEVEMRNARRWLCRGDGDELYQLALKGPNPPPGLYNIMSDPVNVILTEAIEIISVTEHAKNRLTEILVDISASVLRTPAPPAGSYKKFRVSA